MMRARRMPISLVAIVLTLGLNLGTSWGVRALTAGGGELPVAESDLSEMESSRALHQAERTRELQARFLADYRLGNDTSAVFKRYLPALGADAILDLLEKTFPLCHEHAHQLGRTMFAQTRHLGAALLQCAHRCTGGCMHGVVSEAFSDGDSQALRKEMATVCQQAVGYRPGNCAHGIGHALMILTSHHLQKALAACADFHLPGMEFYCATGVFMDYEDTLWDEHGTPQQDMPAARYREACDTYVQFPAACYRYLLRHLDVMPEAIIQMCLGKPEHERRGCFHGFGALYTRTIAEDPSLLPAVCVHGDATDQIMCIEGAIEKLADHDEDLAMSACRTLKARNAEVCEDAAKGKMYRLDKPTLGFYTSRKALQFGSP